ncbi:BQ5605_C038g11693 [Microbotryum silenes-dioicae]|uniref:BQ5605_C038g11693 protein n=1 Tax=Microbotryum silenes-dioicae TaxID=796604 RepID=A0A2X0MIX0_9BASI|nr:BQ5605_C038g11693 [Microbotryum silenes-dioicae]
MAPKPPVKRLEAPGLPGFFAWVVVDGVDAPIYDPHIEGNKAVGYIESKERKSYAVKFRDERLSAPTDLDAWVYIDGTKQRGILAKKDHARYGYPLDHPARETILSGRLASKTSERPFVFGKIRLTDDDNTATKVEETIKNAGTIQVRVIQSQHLGPTLRDTVSYNDNPDPPVLHEKSKKASLSHTTAFGSTVPLRGKLHLCDTVALGDLSSPMGFIEFRYRARILLELEDRIESKRSRPNANSAPRSASTIQNPGDHLEVSDSSSESDDLASASSAESEPSESEVEGLTPEEKVEARRLKAELAKLNSKRKKKRKMKKQGGADRKPKIKPEVKSLGTIELDSD